MDYYHQEPKIEHVQYVAAINTVDRDNIKKNVQDAYGQVAKANKESKSCGNGCSCCGISWTPDPAYLEKLGYTQEELKNAPESSNMGLGCGNPQAIADLKQGEVVLDLGAGGGFDAFLASRKVEQKGKVYGVDMTPEMLSAARENARKEGYANVEFLLGEIEHLPLPDKSVDVIISNCVISDSKYKRNLSWPNFF